MGFQQAEHAVHVGQALLDLAVDHAEKIERNIQLDHEGIDQHQITKRHGAGNHAGSGAPDHQTDRHRDDGRLAGIQQRQRGLGLDRRILPALQAFIITTRFEFLVVEVLDGFIIEQRINGAYIGLGIEVVHAAPEVRAPFSDQNGEADVNRQR